MLLINELVENNSILCTVELLYLFLRKLDLGYECLFLKNDHWRILPNSRFVTIILIYESNLVQGMTFLPSTSFTALVTE